MSFRFRWDRAKAKSNFEKHAVNFEDAQTVFYDPMAETNLDLTHSDDEERYITIGSSLSGILLIVVHAEDGETIRIISARRATKGEQRRYEQDY